MSVFYVAWRLDIYLDLKICAIPLPEICVLLLISLRLLPACLPACLTACLPTCLLTCLLACNIICDLEE